MTSLRNLGSFCLLASLSMLALGCGPASPTASSSGPSAEGAAYILEAEPAAPKEVKAARAEAGDGEEVAVVGRIGGDTNPWVEGQAAFLLVDSVLKPCNEKDDDACPTPWDYCCDYDTLPEHKIMVKLVDAQGETVATGARELLGVKELQTVVVHGNAKRDEAGNLTLLADSVYLRN